MPSVYIRNAKCRLIMLSGECQHLFASQHEQRSQIEYLVDTLNDRRIHIVMRPVGGKLKVPVDNFRDYA